MLGNILMNRVVRKPRQRVDAQIDFDFSLVGLAEFQQPLRQLLHLRHRESPRLVMFRGSGSAALSPRLLFRGGGHFAKATPTFTFRKREGEAPCPVPMVCIGWPLPQFGVPHSVQYSREQIAS